MLDDAAIDDEIMDKERAAVTSKIAERVIADLDDARASEQDAIETCVERQMADLERETT